MKIILKRCIKIQSRLNNNIAVTRRLLFLHKKRVYARVIHYPFKRFYYDSEERGARETSRERFEILAK